MPDQVTLTQVPIIIQCARCHWAGDIRECPVEPVGYLHGGEIDYENEAVCPQCACPTFE